MISPYDLLREQRARGLREVGPRPRTRLEKWLSWPLTIALAVVAIAIVEALESALDLRWRGDLKLALLVVGAPIVLVVTGIRLWYLRWRERGTIPFAFPVRISLPRWRIAHREGDDALFLTDGRAVLALILRDGDDPALAALAALIDVDGLETANESEWAVSFTIGEDAGELRRVGERDDAQFERRGYVCIVGTRDALNDVGGILATATRRHPGDPIQKWRPLD